MIRLRASGLERQRYWTAFLFLLPATAGILFFLFIPIAQALRISLFDYALLNPEQTFVGFANYRQAWKDPVFRVSLNNTMLFTVLLVTLQTLAALVLALLLKQKVRGVGLFRSAFFIPVVTSLVVISTVWKLLYNSQGFINSMLRTLGAAPQPFLSSPDQALMSLVVMSVWKDVDSTCSSSSPACRRFRKSFMRARQSMGRRAGRVL